MNNNALLLLTGAKKIRQTIGVAGQQGFGVGVYGGNSADLTAIGLSPMQGCKDPASENYGNYQHTNGSVMVFIPAFCYRIGNPSAPSYSRDGDNALEIRDAALGVGDGWILHRAFIDGGQQKRGFFMDKYICSKDKTRKLAISVKNADCISLASSHQSSSTMSDCDGTLYDSITLSRARGNTYSLTTGFQWAAISMLSLAHGQAANSAQWCGWFDETFTTNYPKGNNNNLKDYNDPAVTWIAHSSLSTYGTGKTGSGSPFNKTTHNGQTCGITDINGNMAQVTLGIMGSSSGNYNVLRDTVRASSITKENVLLDSLYELYHTSNTQLRYYWGNNAFYRDVEGTQRALCGLIPQEFSLSKSNLFGADLFKTSTVDKAALLVAGFNSGRQEAAGMWYRFFGAWSDSDTSISFRVTGYAL